MLSSRVRPDGTLGFFHPDRFTFGQPVYLSAIVAAAQAVPGVESVVAHTFQRQRDDESSALDTGVLEMHRLEIARLDNDPTFPDRGVLASRLEAASERVDRPAAAARASRSTRRSRSRTGPGLSAIAYRVGVHGDFLASMIAGLTDVDRPRSPTLGTRDRDDFSIALLDAWAVAADVLAFYNERLANESYLRTARERTSLQELGRLIGYRLRPGVAAETYSRSRSSRRRTSRRRVEGSGLGAAGDAGAVTLEPGLRVQSIPGPGEQPQTFETVEEIEARPEWNAMAATQTLAQPPAIVDASAWLDGSAST